MIKRKYIRFDCDQLAERQTKRLTKLGHRVKSIGPPQPILPLDVGNAPTEAPPAEPPKPQPKPAVPPRKPPRPPKEAPPKTK